VQNRGFWLGCVRETKSNSPGDDTVAANVLVGVHGGDRCSPGNEHKKEIRRSWGEGGGGCFAGLGGGGNYTHNRGGAQKEAPQKGSQVQ